MCEASNIKPILAIIHTGILLPVLDLNSSSQLFCRQFRMESYINYCVFDPTKHGLEAEFRLTDFTGLKG